MVRPRGKETLTKDESYARALAIVDEEGLAALTMRRLACDVGVKAPSLYNHVPSKEALIDGMLALMRSEVRLPDPPPGDWMELTELIFREAQGLTLRLLVVLHLRFWLQYEAWLVGIGNMSILGIAAHMLIQPRPV